MIPTHVCAAVSALPHLRAEQSREAEHSPRNNSGALFGAYLAPRNGRLCTSKSLSISATGAESVRRPSGRGTLPCS